MAQTFALSASSASRVGRKAFSGLSDDRVVVDTALRLFAVADGSGPTYGGYYAPIGMDVGLSAICATLASKEHVHDCDEACVVAAIATAHDKMQSLDAAYKVALEDEACKTANRLDASLRASRAVARTVGRSIDSFAHFYASISAVYFTSTGKVVVSQVGSCRAYRWRRGTLTLLLPDHCIPHPDMEGVVTRMLGAPSNTTPSDIGIESVEVGDRYVLCSDGAWRTFGERDLKILCTESDATTIASSLIAHKDAADDASVIVLVVT